MAERLSPLSLHFSHLWRLGYTQICAVHGTVSWRSKGDAAAELQLWYHESWSVYRIYAGYTEGDGMVVCKVIDVFLHFQECTDKIKTLLTKKAKFHFVQY